MGTEVAHLASDPQAKIGYYSKHGDSRWGNIDDLGVYPKYRKLLCIGQKKQSTNSLGHDFRTGVECPSIQCRFVDPI